MDAQARMEKVRSHPLESMEEICNTVCNGGSLIALCEELRIPYNRMVNWIYDDEDRHKQYEKSLHARGEWVAQKVLDELRKVSFIDIRKILNDDGSLKPVSQWPDDIAHAVSGIDIMESDAGDSVTRKVKLIDKLKSIELIGKNLKMFTDKHELTAKVTLGDLVLKSMEDSDGETKTET